MQVLSRRVRPLRQVVVAGVATGFVALAAWLVQRWVEPLRVGGAPVEAFPGRLVLPGSVVRLQVVAHSDHPLDQAAKLAVRDQLLPVVERLYREAPQAARRSPLAWLAYVERHRGLLLAAARRALDMGPWPAWPVRVETGPAAFAAGPSDASGAVQPAGAYPTVRVVIGAGRGHNWWCVAFPLLCPAPRPDGSRAAAAEAHRARDGPAPAAVPEGAGRGAAEEPPTSRRQPVPWWWRWWPGHWF